MAFWRQLNKQERKRFIIWAFSALLIALTLWLSRNVLGLYVIGLVLAYLLAPAVDWFQKGIERLAKRIRFKFLEKRARGLSIVLSYLILIGMITGFIAIIIPVINREATDLWDRREELVEDAQQFFENVSVQYELLPDQIRSQLDEVLLDFNEWLADILQTVLDQIVNATTFAFNFTVSIVLGISIVPFWTFYLLRDFPHIKRSIFSVVPEQISADVRSIVLLMDRTIGAWVRGELVLMLVVGIMTFIVAMLLKLPYALLLAVLGGLLEVIPNLGPTLASIPAILLALQYGPVWAIMTAISYNLIQQLENSLIVPRVMGQSLRLHPVVMMVMIVVGTEIGGLPGLLMAPILTSVLRDIYLYASYRLADAPLQPKQAMNKVVALGLQHNERKLRRERRITLRKMRKALKGITSKDEADSQASDQEEEAE